MIDNELIKYLRDDLCPDCVTKYRRDGQCTASRPCILKRASDIIQRILEENLQLKAENDSMKLLQSELLQLQGRVENLQQVIYVYRSKDDETATFESIKEDIARRFISEMAWKGLIRFCIEDTNNENVKRISGSIDVLHPPGSAENA